VPIVPDPAADPPLAATFPTAAEQQRRRDSRPNAALQQGQKSSGQAFRIRCHTIDQKRISSCFTG